LIPNYDVRRYSLCIALHDKGPAKWIDTIQSANHSPDLLAGFDLEVETDYSRLFVVFYLIWAILFVAVSVANIKVPATVNVLQNYGRGSVVAEQFLLKFLLPPPCSPLEAQITCIASIWLLFVIIKTSY